MKFYKHWLCLILPHTFYGTKTQGSTSAPNPLQGQLAAIAEERWKNYKEKYIPIQNEWIKNVQDLDSKAYHNQASGLVSNEIKMQSGPITQGLASSTIGHRFGAGNYINQASAISQAGNKANLGVTNRYLNGMGDVIAQGQGQASTTISGLANLAGQSVDAQIQNDQNAMTRKQDQLNTYGALMGAGVRGGTAIAAA